MSTGLKTVSKMPHVLGRQLLRLLFTYSGHGKYSQDTSGLLNTCYRLRVSYQPTVSKQKFDYSPLYSFGLEDQFSAMY